MCIRDRLDGGFSSRAEENARTSLGKSCRRERGHVCDCVAVEYFFGWLKASGGCASRRIGHLFHAEHGLGLDERLGHSGEYVFDFYVIDILRAVSDSCVATGWRFLLIV